MIDTIALTLVDGVRIVVPDSLFLITPYILREQHDFFEDELPFVRQLAPTGSKCNRYRRKLWRIYAADGAKSRGERSRLGIRARVEHRGIPRKRHREQRVFAGDGRAEGDVERLGHRTIGLSRPGGGTIDRSRLEFAACRK